MRAAVTTVWVRHVSETRSTWKRAKTSGAALPFGRSYSIGHIKLNQRTSDLHGLLEKLSILAKGPVMKDAINAMRGSAKYDWDSLTYGPVYKRAAEVVRHNRLPVNASPAQQMRSADGIEAVLREWLQPFVTATKTVPHGFTGRKKWTPVASVDKVFAVVQEIGTLLSPPPPPLKRKRTKSSAWANKKATTSSSAPF